MAGYLPVALADTLTGTLGADAGAVDVKQITCATTDAGATYRLAVQVKNGTASAPLVSAQTFKGKKASNTTDLVSGDEEFSPESYVTGGDGDYAILVSKSGSGTADYTLQTECQTGQGVFSPPSVSDEINEGQSAVLSLQIQQGCDTGDRINPAIAQSVVFPGDAGSYASFRSDTGDSVNLTDVISNANGLAGLVALIQSNDTFKMQDVKVDGNGNNIGFHGSKGKLPANLFGAVPFAFTAPTFQSNSCAKRLLVKIAVADICKISKTPATGEANLWIPNATDKFKDGSIVLGSGSAARSGLPATLTVNRVSTLDAGCGGGYDVTVWPSNDHVDTYLPIPKYWPK